MYCIHLNFKIWCAVESGFAEFALRPPQKKNGKKHHDNIWMFQPLKVIQPVNANSLTMESFPTIFGLRAGSGWVNQQSIIKHTTHGALKHIKHHHIIYIYRYFNTNIHDITWPYMTLHNITLPFRPDDLIDWVMVHKTLIFRYGSKVNRTLWIYHNSHHRSTLSP